VHHATTTKHVVALVHQLHAINIYSSVIRYRPVCGQVTQAGEAAPASARDIQQLLCMPA
jgi:hypothetical protein